MVAVGFSGTAQQVHRNVVTSHAGIPIVLQAEVKGEFVDTVMILWHRGRREARGGREAVASVLCSFLGTSPRQRTKAQLPAHDGVAFCFSMTSPWLRA